MSKKYVSPNTGQNHKLVYHTDPNCRSVENVRPASDHEIEHHNLDLCEYCDPEKNPTHTNQSREHYKALKEAAKND
jgi:hypothetical protein